MGPAVVADPYAYDYGPPACDWGYYPITHMPARLTDITVICLRVACSSEPASGTAGARGGAATDRGGYGYRGGGYAYGGRSGYGGERGLRWSRPYDGGRWARDVEAQVAAIGGGVARG